MIVRDFGAVLLIGLVLAGLGGAFYASHKFEKEDGPIEEAGEAIAENALESLLGLDNDELQGLIDVSIGSPEKRDDE